MTFGSLKDFSLWWRAQPAWPISMPENPLRLHPGGSELILYRDDDYQAELVTIWPGHPVPPHKHPNVAAVEVRICGENIVMVAGRTMPGHLADKVGRIPVPRNVIHGGNTTTGGAYVSLQKWYTKPLGFITDDWDGPPWH